MVQESTPELRGNHWDERSSQPRDLGVQGHGWRLLARPGCAPGRLDSCLRAGRLGEPEVLAWGRDMRPLSNQGNSRHQSHRTCAGERGLGSAVPLKEPPASTLAALHGDLRVGLGRLRPVAAPRQVPQLGLLLSSHSPQRSPRRTALWQGPAPLSPSQLPSLRASPTCPQAKGSQHRWENA